MPKLTLIEGGRVDHVRLGAVRVEPAPMDAPPFAVEARVFEEDTCLVLSADPEIRLSDEHPIRTMTGVLDFQPHEPGAVIVRERRTLELLAVVHDLALDPTTREAWVIEALDAVFDEVRRRAIASIALPVLGCVHGRLAPERVLELIARRLDTGDPGALVRLWLVVPDEQVDSTLEALGRNRVDRKS